MTTFPKGHHERRPTPSGQIPYNVDQATRTTSSSPPTATTIGVYSAQDLRGIPAIAPGVAGCIPGTNPASIR